MIAAWLWAPGCSGASLDGLATFSRAAHSLAEPTAKERTYLYVGETGSGGYVRAYLVKSLRQLREYQEPWGANAMGVDRWGDLYVTSSDVSGGQLIAFTPGARAKLLEINNVNQGFALTFDGSGNVYVAETYIEEYAARATIEIRTIKIRNAVALAVDGSSSLYAATFAGSGSRGAVFVVPPGAKKPSREITKGVDVPRALLLDGSNDLFVANCPSCYANGGRGSVTEYPSGASAPSRTIEKGIDNPSALAMGANGLLFVGNDPRFSRGSVSVYSSSSVPVRTITDQIDGPDALAIGPNGDLYVANCHACNGRNGGSVTVYSPDGSQLVGKIKDGFIDPNVMAIGGE